MVRPRLAVLPLCRVARAEHRRVTIEQVEHLHVRELFLDPPHELNKLLLKSFRPSGEVDFLVAQVVGLQPSRLHLRR